jgi:hypothetical protein
LTVASRLARTKRIEIINLKNVLFDLFIVLNAPEKASTMCQKADNQCVRAPLLAAETQLKVQLSLPTIALLPLIF